MNCRAQVLITEKIWLSCNVKNTRLYWTLNWILVYGTSNHIHTYWNACLPRTFLFENFLNKWSVTVDELSRFWIYRNFFYSVCSHNFSAALAKMLYNVKHPKRSEIWQLSRQLAEIQRININRIISHNI